MSMFIVFVLSKTNCDKEPPENIRDEWKLMNQIEQWFSLRKRGSFFGTCVCQGEGLERYCETRSFRGFLKFYFDKLLWVTPVKSSELYSSSPIWSQIRKLISRKCFLDVSKPSRMISLSPFYCDARKSAL